MKKILVIDDERMYRETVRSVLTLAGYEVFEAESGEKGVEIAQSQTVDMVVCDITLGNLDGFGVIERLRLDPATNLIPFIFMSGLSDRENVRKGMELGADDYLTKPFTADELLATVEARFAKQREMAEKAEKKLNELRSSISFALPHELRTPLASILGFAQVLSDDPNSLTLEEIAQAARVIQKAGTRLQRLLERQFIQAQKMESIGTLAGGIAHDFNNILGIILGHLALLQRLRENQSQFNESISSISKAVERGASLVRQVLTFARRADMKTEPLNVNNTIKELAKMLTETFPKAVSISLQLEKTIPIITIDSTQFHQALLNLCVNARDAMQGEGTLTIVSRLVAGETLTSRFTKATAKHYVQLKISDTGVGMDEETKGCIFEPFFTTKEEGKGTGLGLAVVYGVVQAHNGFVDVDSTPGIGTTFHLFFPVPEGIVTIGQEQVLTPAELPRGSETILVVEDEEVLRGSLVKMLEMQGYTVLSASDGDNAVRQFTEHGDRIALVLSDMGLPKRSGWQAFRMMQRVRPNVRFVLASGYMDPAQKLEILNSGVKKFIHKPFPMEEVLKAIRETLDEKP